VSSTPRTVLVVVGTRPEAIKMAPVVAALRAFEPRIAVKVALTGQHTDLVDQTLDALSLEPDYDLGIMKEGQTLYDVVHGTLDGLGDVVRHLGPDVVLVQGDTATVFTASLVGYFEHVRVGHVEAGLRSGNKWAPFPEEVFRRLTDVLADFHFAPTAGARTHLEREGVPSATIHVTGNTVVDALHRSAERRHTVADERLRALLDDDTARLILLTAHRRESFGEPLRRIFGAVRALADRLEDVHVVYPVHPNPAVVGTAQDMLADHPRIHLLEPLGYLDIVAAMRGASLVLTDSGGIQEEAPAFGVPVLVLREVTERPEGIDAGVAELVGTDPDRILAASVAALSDTRGAPRPNPYGDGRAGERIADILAADLLGQPRRTEDWDG
jgi:UDP-N-acetylglucosamine 2-epimerase (non-hydrolysing)